MITVTVAYPAADAGTFDWEYYLSTHMPLVQAEMGSALVSFSSDRGVASLVPGEAAPYAAVTRMVFESLEALQAGMEKSGDKLLADIPNYTNVNPVFQISEIMA
jgi:uncharacterized protein (TIGR02118 family)